MSTPRPRVTLKLATSLDGKIALGNGQSEWITCEDAREAGRRLRGRHDAIAVGANTAVMDNPQLTTRIAGETDPVRVVFDTHLRLSLASELAKTAKVTPVYLLSAMDDGEKAESLREMGVRIFKVAAQTHVNLDAALTALFRAGVKTLLIEGGGTLAASFVRAGYIDEIHWFRAPIILGGDGKDGVADLDLTQINHAARFKRISVTEVGTDLHEHYSAET